MIGLTPPEEGGSERHIFEICSRMRNIKVLTQKGSVCSNKIGLPIMKNHTFLRNINFALACYIYSIKLLLWKRNYDIIHIHENLLYFLAPLLKFRYEIIITVHGIKGFKFYDSKSRWFFFKFALKFAQKIIAVNKEDESILKREFKMVHYIPNGVDISVYKIIKSKLDKKITFIGRIHEQKGIIYLLEAFDLISKKYPKYKLEIIGKENDYAKKLKSEFKNENIVWTGFIDNKKEIALRLKSSYCIVLPSLWEGLPLTLFESLASERPTIVSDINAFKSVIKDEALFFESRNSNDLSKKIEYLIKNINKADLLGKEGAKLAIKYDWNNIAKQTLSYYEK